MSYGKTQRLKPIAEFNKRGKISKHFAKYSNIKATPWQTIKLQSIIHTKIGIKPLWAMSAHISVGKPE